jgi:hypothetical protein
MRERRDRSAIEDSPRSSIAPPLGVTVMYPARNPRSVTIPETWLACPTTVAEVEEQLASEWMPDVWLEYWWALLKRFGPDDELWEYWNVESGPSGEVDSEKAGYALVRDGEVIDSIELPWWSWW